MSVRASIRELLAAGSDLHARGDLAEAERCFQRIVLLDPQHPAGLHRLGQMAHLRGDHARAADLIGRALARDPRRADAHHDLGLALAALGRTEAALDHFSRAATLDPSHAQAALQTARTLAALGRGDEAGAWNARFADLTTDHAKACLRRGETHEALALLCRALEIDASDARKSLFVRWLRAHDTFPDTLPLAELLPRAIAEPWGRPQDLAPLAISLIKMRGPVADLLARTPLVVDDAAYAAIAGNRMLAALMENVPIADIRIEELLRRLRSDVLARAAAGDDTRAVPTVACLLAHQCFINEYLYDLGDEDRVRAAALRERLMKAADDGPPSLLLVAAVASCFPLHSLRLPGMLDKLPWPDAGMALIARQLHEPRRERALCDAIPRLTPIDDAVSQRVRAQYEENPYPRWIKPAPQPVPVPFDTALSEDLPRAPLRPLRKTDKLDVLVAGCGTGQQAIETARRFAGAHVLAVDLSLASLAYARRKTDELGLTNIDYAQADILKLPECGRDFDVIDSVGVLHHMADPFAGWQALLDILRPGGAMRVGLYSRLARSGISAAQTLAAARGYAADPDGIRACRRDILALPADAPARAVLKFNDFYSMSECRDLLFHVQEHLLTVPQLADFIARSGVAFLGFIVGPQVRDAYAARFPKDKRMTDLANWHIFETERPDTFAGMYQFWVQKPSS